MARQKRPFDAVQFTRESAERIAGVVRAAELATPAARPLTFDKRFPERVPKQVRAATFSGAWPIGSVKTVTFKYAPAGTASVANLSWPITLAGYVNENCLVGKEGTNWWLVVPVLQSQTAVFVTQTATAFFSTGTATQSVATGISLSKSTINYVTDVSATLNTANCTITVSKSNGSVEVVTGGTVSSGTITISSGTTTGVFIQQTATATFLRLRVP